MVSIASNAASFFIDRHVDEGRGAKTAFTEVESGRRVTFDDLKGGAEHVAGALIEAGVRPEERAAMLVLDQIEFPQIFWGAIKCGVIPVPLNTLLATSVYDLILRDSRASILFVSDALYDSVAPVLADNPFLRQVVVIGADRDGAQGFDDFTKDATPLATRPASNDEVAFWLYSSGSTGQPKGVSHVHSALRATSDTYGKEILSIEEGDRVLSAAKLFFAYGLGNAMTFPLSVGADTLLFSGRPTPDAMIDAITRYQPTIFCGVPTLYAAMTAQMDRDGMEQTAIRCCISAGEALPADIGRRWEKHLGVGILDGVGSTEMLHIFLSNRADDIVYGTSGRAVPGYALRLVDEAGEEVDAGGIGELLVNGASAANSYWNQRDKSRGTFEGVWTRTGDKYEKLENGRLVYCGRTDDMFKVSGIWLSPFEVEGALISHPRVLEAAVVARRDEDGLEKPMAFVVLKSGEGDEALRETLKAHVKDQIGKWKYPRWIECVPELPKTATGKIQRFKLREDNGC